MEKLKKKIKLLRSGIQGLVSGENMPLLLIYSLGKVGSSTVYETLKSIYGDENVVHVHFLSDYFVNEVLPGTNHTWNIQRAQKTKQLIDEARWARRPIKIVTLVREPVSREISNFFQNPVDFIDGSIDQYDEITLFEKFMDQVSFDYVLNWFDHEFKAYTGIDIYRYPIDHNKGYVTFSENRFDVLLIRLEDLSTVFQPAFRELLGCDIDALAMANQSAKKGGVPPVLAHFKKSFRLGAPFLEQIYSSRYMQHFYSTEEISMYRQKWVAE